MRGGFWEARTLHTSLHDFMIKLSPSFYSNLLDLVTMSKNLLFSYFFLQKISFTKDVKIIFCYHNFYDSPAISFSMSVYPSEVHFVFLYFSFCYLCDIYFYFPKF